MAINAEDYDVFIKDFGAKDGTYKGVGCIQGQSDLLSRGEREIKESSCANIGVEDDKSLKKIKYPTATLIYKYSPTATDGRKTIIDAYEDGKKKLTVKVVLDDKAEGGTHGTYFERDVLVSKVDPKDEDGDWAEESTFALLGKRRETAAA